jgi:amino acid transporter
MAEVELVALVAVDVAVAVAAPVTAAALSTYCPLQIGAALVGVWTFLMVWRIQHGNSERERKRTAVRDAIVSAFVASYLVIVGWSLFARTESGHLAGNLDPLAQTLLAHFTYLTGIVVAAHVGAGAVEAVGARRSGTQPDVGSEDTQE